MNFKKLFEDWGKFLGFALTLVIIPVLTAIPVAKTYDIQPKTVYFYFICFYIISFIIVGTPHWVRYIARKEVYEILNKEKIIGNKNVNKK